MNQVFWENLIQLISEHIGFYIKIKDYPSLESKIQARINSLKLSNLGDYYNLLNNSINSELGDTSPQKIYQGKQEWNALANIITNGESFFFRDRGQFFLLKETLIPELIEKKREAIDFTLKIWSSGCSTGQEPYSLAILLSQIIPDISQWNITIIGTDINQDFLNKAKIGIYQDWSFRLTEPLFKKKYFTSIKQGWQINNNIKKLVIFCEDNIVQDRIIPVPCQDVDLILCRNVFIYFEKSSVAKGINKFYGALNSGGYLMTGHAELQGLSLNAFKTLSFPESVIYQKPKNTSDLLQTNINYESIKTNLETDITWQNLNFDSNNFALDDFDLNDEVITPSQEEVTLKYKTQNFNDNSLKLELENLLSKGQYNQVIEQGNQINERQPEKHLIYYIVARAYANQDNMEQAQIYCNKVLDIDSIFIPALYLLAQIAETQNNLKKAKEFLKRIIYLEPSSVIAYLELGSIYTSEGDLTRASKMYYSAYEILQNLPSHKTFDYQGIITASQLMTHLQKKLSN